MQTVTIAQIAENLRKLPEEKLAVVFDFVNYLTEREMSRVLRERATPIEFMYATEGVLRRDWDRPEEDAAWADL